jgi:hypothetical protein
MGLNFHLVCHRHRVTGMILRGQETPAMYRFYSEHTECRRADKNAVEVQADEESEQWWMVSPPPSGYREVEV